MEPRTDRRAARTKKLLRQALLDLIGEKKLDRITVSELSERADINRGTFYLHYRDVPDMIDQLKQEMMDGLKNQISHVDFLALKAAAEQGFAYPPILNMLKYIETQSDLFLAFVGPNGDYQFPFELKQFIRKNMYDQFFRFAEHNYNGNIPLDYLIAYMSSANLGLLTHWLETGMQIPVEQIARMLTQIMYKGPLLSTFVM
ncbi:MAG: TetR family transcriptional regulator [Paenibacillus sp.]|jgi:AcrR family transcriptional regulator|nr:TetR family transcriptional regulator [Paenibacillus sp.]